MKHIPATSSNRAAGIPNGTFTAMYYKLSGGGTIETMDGVEHNVSKWDMMIAHPPCTKTSNAGANHLWRNKQLNVKRYYEGMCGKALFMALLHADIQKIAIENPTPSAVFEFPKPTQIIQPYMFGDPYTKRTLLWLKGLPKLQPTNVVEPRQTCHEAGTWFTKGGVERQKNRSKTFYGIAEAMAEQWGGEV